MKIELSALLIQQVNYFFIWSNDFDSEGLVRIAPRGVPHLTHFPFSSCYKSRASL